MFNEIILLGHVGAEPIIYEKKTTENFIVARVSLATNTYWTDNNGNKKEKTEWHKLVFFNRLAEIVQQYVGKGSTIHIRGHMTYKKYQDKNGIDKVSAEVICEDIKLVGRSSNTPTDKKEINDGQSKINFNTEQEFIDNDIPF